MDINKNLKAVIKDVSIRDIDIKDITNETVLTSDLGFDSVQIISLIV